MVWVDKGALAVLSDAAVAAMVEGATATRGRVDARAVAAVAVSEAGEPARIASQLSSPTAARSAVDARINARVGQEMGNVLANQPGLVESVVDAIEATPGMLGQLTYTKALSNGSNLDDLMTPGEYTIGSWGIANSLIGKPAGLNAINPAVLQVEKASDGYGLVKQVWTTQPETNATPQVTVNRRKLRDGTWTAWDFGDSSRILSGQDLDSFTIPGNYFCDSRAIAESLTGFPKGILPDPFSLRVDEVSRANNGSRQTLTIKLRWGAEVTQLTRLRWGGTYQPWTPRVGWELEGSRVVMWGDSAIEGHGAAPAEQRIPTVVGTLVSQQVVNQGKGGFTARAVLLRAGVVPLYARSTTGVIPATGAVLLDLGGRALPLGGTTDFVQVYWHGIWGNVRRTFGGTWSFTRITAGDEIPATGFAKVHAFTGLLHSDTHIFMMGGNDFLNPTEYQPERTMEDHLVAEYARAVEAIPASGERHVLIAGVKSRRSTVANDEQHQTVINVNNRLRAMYPQHFVSRQDWLVNRSLAAAGITPTTDDLTAMSNGLVPPSAFDDDTHIKGVVMAAEAEELWAAELIERGWATPA